MAWGVLLNRVPTTGGTNTDGPVGTGARLFDGTQRIVGQLATAADIVAAQGQWTIEAFIRPDVLPIAAMAVVQLGGNAETQVANAQMSLQVTSTGRLRVFWERGAGLNSDHVSVGTVLVVATWYHVAAVKNATHVRFYVNGTFSDEIVRGTNTDGGTTASWYIGDSATATEFFNGAIRAVKISNTALSDADILTSAGLLSTTATFPMDTNSQAVWHLGAADTFSLDTGGEPVDETVPVITAVTVEGAIVVADPIELEVTDTGDNLDLIVISATYGADYVGDEITETVYDGAAFTGTFVTNSTTGAIANGFEYALERDGGWPSADVTINVTAIDDAGNSATDSLVYTTDFVEDLGDVTPPTISNFVPAADTAIAKTGTIQFDVLDVDSAFTRVMLIAQFTSVDQPELVYDGDDFTPNYSNGSNTVTTIANGFRFVLLRNGGWLSAVSIIPIAIDASGNENS